MTGKSMESGKSVETFQPSIAPRVVKRAIGLPLESGKWKVESGKSKMESPKLNRVIDWLKEDVSRLTLSNRKIADLLGDVTHPIVAEAKRRIESQK